MGRSVETVPTVEPSPLPVPTAPPVDSINGDLSALTDSPTNLPYENALESGSSLLPLGLDVDSDKTGSSPVSVGGLTQKQFIETFGTNAMAVNKWLREGTFRQMTTQSDGSYWEKREKTFPGDNAVYFHVIPTPSP